MLTVASLCFECVLSRWIGNGGWRSQESYNVTLLCKVTKSGSRTCLLGVLCLDQIGSCEEGLVRKELPVHNASKKLSLVKSVVR
jgi:hypothetical protein